MLRDDRTKVFSYFIIVQVSFFFLLLFSLGHWIYSGNLDNGVPLKLVLGAAYVAIQITLLSYKASQ